jgi:4-amino-4-deoxy-L-arabinose transferase-like glycosyltransferase
MRFLRGLFITAVIVAPWAISVQIATQGAFLDIAIKADFLAKVQSAQESHGAPFGTYFLLLPLLCFPASLFAGHLAMIGKDIFKRDKGRFLIAWLVGYWLIIELVPTKLPHYVLPALPALWLLVVMCFAYPAPIAKWRIRLSYGISGIAALSGAALALVLGVLALRYGGVGSGAAFFFSLLAILLTAGLLALFWRWMKAPQSALMAGILALGIIIQMVIVAGVIANANRIHPSSALASEIAGLKSRPALIAAAGYHEPSMVFLLGRDVLLVQETEAALLLAEAPDGLAIIEARKKQTFLETATKLDLSLEEVARVDGFNISKGQDITLSLYRRKAE